MDTPGIDKPGIDKPGSTGEAASGASSQDAEHGSPGDPVPDDEAARVISGAPGVPSEGVRPGQPDQASRQGFGRQRDEPQDQPPADVLDNQNIAGDKDFELQPPTP